VAAMSEKKRLLASFSGGRTSAFMTKWLIENMQHDYDIKVVFANTGEEHEKTLEFVRNCDQAFGYKAAWVESVPQARGKSSAHRIATFDTAARNGEPFEAMIEKYGIPNASFPHCTRELKLNPIKSYLTSIGWEPGTYETAVGIRTDEMRRVSKGADSARIIYPLVDMIPVDKQDVNDWADEQQFRLDLPERLGNCKTCWKKSFQKHYQNIEESPEFYDFNRRMEEKHGRTGAGAQVGLPRVFFRGNTSTIQLFKLAEVGALPKVVDPRQMNLDLNGGCSESCELYPMEDAA
jgi:hypothetical protein